MDSGFLVGVSLVGEAESSGEHVLGAIHVSSSSKALTLKDFRGSVISILPSSFTKKQFLFLTPQGWEINENIEHVVKLSNVLSSDNLLKICIAYDKPRIGILVEGPPDIPVGFVFCDFGSTVENLLDELKTQLPSLFSILIANTQFSFLDRNGWPISKDQERLLTVLEISSGHTVKIRCAGQKRKVLQTPVDKIELPERPAIRRSVSEPFTSLFVPFPDPTRSLTSPVNERAEMMEVNLEESLNAEYKPSPTASCEILLSYVHKEAGSFAILLKESLEKLGYSVFLDVHCIQGGVDWQDTLNEAINNCTLFIPLITMLYGQTIWTNREVKLADVLGKIIIPVNFLKSWPPKCLAIQFATTQYIMGKESTSETDGPDEKVDEGAIATVATDIIQYYQKALKSESADEKDIEMSTEKRPSLITRQSTIEIDNSSPTSPGTYLLSPPGNPLRRKSTLKSYASTLPKSLPDQYREAIVSFREGKPLVVISCSPKQKEFAQEMVEELQAKQYEVWCSCDIDESEDDEKKGKAFQKKVDEAGVVVFVLSKDFAASTFCEQQVYYCEQRKRIIPLLYDPGMHLPDWMALLIGTSTFIDCQGRTFKTAFMERLDAALNPQKVQNELKAVLKQKTELANLCLELSNKLPKGKLVYISGGTKFFSSCGEAIAKELGKQLAQISDVVLVTGGFYGVGETVGRSFYEERMKMRQPHGVCHVIPTRDDQDKSNQTRQNDDGTFPPVPYGDTLFFGNSVRQREQLTPKVIDVCILIEGGPGAAFEAQQFNWNGHHVIPIKVTGGAASGMFNVPQTILSRPPNVPELDWSLLDNKGASPRLIASAVVRIVQTLKDPIRMAARSRSSTGNTTGSLKMKRNRVLVRRAETFPEKRAFSIQIDPTDSTLQAVKRVLSTQDTSVRKQRSTNIK